MPVRAPHADMPPRETPGCGPSARPQTGRAGSHLGRARGPAAGFTLVELMVVVAIVALLAVLALPNMGQAALDRHVFEDASRVTDFFRAARARAMGRGAAVLVTVDVSGGGGGVYRARESVTPNPNATQAARVPRGTCMTPTNWTTPAGYHEYDVLNLDTSYETDNGIKARAFTGGLSQQTKMSFCFTPMGRIYRTLSVPTAGMFDGTTNVLDTSSIEFARVDASNAPVGLVRRAVIPPNGVARIISSTTLTSLAP